MWMKSLSYGVRVVVGRAESEREKRERKLERDSETYVFLCLLYRVCCCWREKDSCCCLCFSFSPFAWDNMRQPRGRDSVWLRLGRASGRVCFSVAKPFIAAIETKIFSLFSSLFSYLIFFFSPPFILKISCFVNLQIIFSISISVEGYYSHANIVG